MMILNSLKTAMSFAGGSLTRGNGTDAGTGGVNGSGPSGAGARSGDPLPGLTLSDELVEDIKKSVETSQSLQRSMESAKDGSRRDKVARLQEKIEQLKERIRFATPQQAKALMKELKQLAREFKGAAKDLGKDGQSLASSSGVSATPGLSVSQTSTEATTAEVLASATSPSLAGTLATSTVSEAGTAADPAAPTSQTAEAGKTSSDSAEGKDAGTTAGEDAKPQTSAEKQQELRKSVLSYVNEQVREEIVVAGGRAEAMKLERDELKKIGNEIKFIAGQIELLHKLGKDDRDDKLRKDQKSALEAVKDGMDELNDPGLSRNLDAALSARDALEGPAAGAASEDPADPGVPPQLGSLAYGASFSLGPIASAADIIA
jgi:hypothetical protein